MEIVIYEHRGRTEIKNPSVEKQRQYWNHVGAQTAGKGVTRHGKQSQ